MLFGTKLYSHVGMDTVQINGKYFTPKSKQGDKIKVGYVLLEFYIELIKRKDDMKDD